MAVHPCTAIHHPTQISISTSPARTFASRKTLRAKLVVLSTCAATPGSPPLTNFDPYWMLRQILSRTSALFRYITRKAISALATSSVAMALRPRLLPAYAPRALPIPKPRRRKCTESRKLQLPPRSHAAAACPDQCAPALRSNSERHRGPRTLALGLAYWGRALPTAPMRPSIPSDGADARVIHPDDESSPQSQKSQGRLVTRSQCSRPVDAGRVLADGGADRCAVEAVGRRWRG